MLSSPVRSRVSLQMNSSMGENATDVDRQFYWLAGSLLDILLALPSNAYVLFLILSTPHKDLSTEFYMMNLSLSEILHSLANVVVLIGKWAPAVSILARLSAGVVFTTRPLFQCCILVEVYLGVVRPVTYLRFKGLKYRVASAAVVWLAGVCASIFAFFCRGTPAFPYFYLFQYVTLLSVKLFCCISVMRALVKPGLQGQATSDAATTARSDIKRRALYTVAIIFTSASLSYSINIVIVLLSFVFTFEDAFTVLYNMCAIVSIPNGVVVPLIYACKAGACTKQRLGSCLARG